VICPPLSSWNVIEGWIARHRDPTSFVLHMFGIPATILGVLLIPIYVMLISIPIFLFALALFVGGYLIQFLGHVVDWTEPGEIAYLRRKLGWSYAKIATAGSAPTGPAPGVAWANNATGTVGPWTNRPGGHSPVTPG
jgi:hypothetical protein